MNKSTFSLIAVLYNNKQAGLYNDVYFPIVKYTIVTLFYQKEKKEYYNIDDISNYIIENFGLHIPIVVLKKSIIHIAKTDKNFDIDVYDKGEEFKIKKAWDYKINEEIESKISKLSDQFNLLEREYSQYLKDNGLEQEHTFVDFISANTDDVLDYLKDKNSLKVDEKYTSIAFFLEHLKNKGDILFEVATDLFWGSVIAGFLSRNETEIKDGKSISNAEYFLDTSIVLGLMKLSSSYIERYSYDLYTALKNSKAIVRVHPITLFEINTILSSVEQNGAYSNSDISFAVAKYNYQSSDIAAKRAHLSRNLEEMGISIFPNVEHNFVQKAIGKYTNKSILKELAQTRGYEDEDSFREIHDVYMHDYINDRLKQKSYSYRCSFVTLNNDLINFYKKKDKQSLLVHPSKLTMDLWMMGNLSSDIKVASLTESISRCFYLNNVDIKNKISILSKFYNEGNPDYSKETFDAILLGLYKRDRKLLRYLDDYQTSETNDSTSSTEEYKQKVIERGNELSVQHKSEINDLKTAIDELQVQSLNKQKKLEADVSNLDKKLDEYKGKYEEANTYIENLKNKEAKRDADKEKLMTEISSLVMQQRKLEVEKHKKEKEIKDMDNVMNTSVSYLDFWFMWIILGVFLIFAGLSMYFSISNGYKDLASIISYIPTSFTGLLTLIKYNSNIFHPKVYKLEIRQRQEEYWINKHPEYKEKKDNLDDISKQIKEMDSELDKLLKK